MDLVVLQTSKLIGGVHHCIHMSDLATADLTQAVEQTGARPSSR